MLIMILYILAIFASLVISFLITAGIVAIVCWALALTFTWKIALTVWLILVLIKISFNLVIS